MSKLEKNDGKKKETSPKGKAIIDKNEKKIRVRKNAQGLSSHNIPRFFY